MKDQWKSFRRAMLPPILFVFLLWLVKLAEIVFDFPLYEFGVLPRTLKGLPGILTFPLIHGDLIHLFFNSAPLLVLGILIYWFYKEIATEVILLIYLMSGVWVWIFARQVYHIGASGLIYGFTAFLFFSGIFRKNRMLMTLSLLVIFLYGSLIWGLLPIDQTISWEGHALGALAGFICSVFYRKKGPENDPGPFYDDDPDDSDPYWMVEDPEKL